MGIITGGILGGFKGKVGAVIGSNWKGIDYMKMYVVPANPQTAGQTAQRTKFKVAVQLAQALLGTLVLTFWNPFAVKMSGFNAFVKSVFPGLSATGLITSAALVTKGGLEGTTLNNTPSYDSVSGDYSVSWDAAISGNGLATDEANVVVLDKTNNKVIDYTTNAAARSAGEYQGNAGTGLTAADLVIFLWFSRGSGETFTVSNSLGSDMQAV